MNKISYLSFLPILLILTLSFTNNEMGDEIVSEKNTIRQIFFNWQSQEIKAHHFWAKDSCNYEFIDKHEFNGTIHEMFGFPDSSEIKFLFGDLNNDGYLDGLVTFTPKQCDGGNASMWDQYNIQIVSDKDNYNIKTDYQAGTSLSIGSTDEGFYWLDSIVNNKLLGTYYQFKDGDGRCCPSIVKRIVIYYDTKKIEAIDKPIPENSLPSDSITSKNYYELLVGKYKKVDCQKNPFLFIYNVLANKTCDSLIEINDHYKFVIQNFTKAKLPIELGPKPELPVKNLQILNDSIFITKSLGDNEYYKTEKGDRTARYYHGCIIDTNPIYDLFLVPYINCCGNDYFLFTVDKNGEMIDKVSIGGFWNDTSETYGIMQKNNQFDVYSNDFVFRKNGKLFLVNNMHFKYKITKAGKFRIE